MKIHYNTLLFLVGLVACTSGAWEKGKEEDADVLLPTRLAKFQHLFLHQNIEVYGCSLLEVLSFTESGKLNTDEMARVDSVLNEELLGGYTDQRGNFIGAYLYAIERPFLNFYPVLLVRYFGVDEVLLVMVLYNKKGEVENAFPVASLFGEVGGCMSSEWKDKGVLMQTVEWHNMGINPKTGKDDLELNYRKQQLVVHSDGTYIEEFLKEWKAFE